MSITIMPDGVLTTDYVTATETKIILSPDGTKWSVSADGTTGVITATDGAVGTAITWTLLDSNGTTWLMTIDNTGVLSSASQEQAIALAPAVNAPILLDGVPAEGYQLSATLSGSGASATLYKNASALSILPQPVPLNAYGLPTDPIHILVGIPYDFILVPPTGGPPVQSWSGVVAGITAINAGATEWSGGSSNALYVSTSSVSIVGDARGKFPAGIRVRISQGSFEYATVLSATYDGETTLLTVQTDVNPLTNLVSLVEASILSPRTGSTPSRRHFGSRTAFAANVTMPVTQGVNLWPVATIILNINPLPSGYLQCNGAAVSRTTYSELFAAVGTTFGVGDGSTTFNLPNIAAVGSLLYGIYAKV